MNEGRLQRNAGQESDEMDDLPAPPLRPVMPSLESLTPGAVVRGILPDRAVSVVQAEWHGGGALTLTYRDDAGKVDQELLYRDDEGRLTLIDSDRTWSLDAD